MYKNENILTEDMYNKGYCQQIYAFNVCFCLTSGLFVFQLKRILDITFLYSLLCFQCFLLSHLWMPCHHRPVKKHQALSNIHLCPA